MPIMTPDLLSALAELAAALAGLVATVLLPLVTARIYRWTGVQIEQKHQKALHEAAMTWAHSATRRGIKPATKQAQDDLLAYLRQAG